LLALPLVKAFHLLPRSQQSWSHSALASTQSDSTAFSTVDVSSKSTEHLIQELLVTARRLGPFGCYASTSEQQYVRALAQQLKERGAGSSAPAREVSSGPFSLIYSDSTGGSSGRFGFLHGSVIQEFIKEDRYVNRLLLGNGLFELALLADLKVKSDFLNTVRFHTITLRAFGQDLFDSKITGGGTWDYLFWGPVVDEKGAPILLRVLLAPSLFIMEQPLPSHYLKQEIVI
jgi:hypothetical protein